VDGLDWRNVAPQNCFGHEKSNFSLIKVPIITLVLVSAQIGIKTETDEDCSVAQIRIKSN
jgi:hypothetical protein